MNVEEIKTAMIYYLQTVFARADLWWRSNCAYIYIHILHICSSSYLGFLCAHAITYLLAVKFKTHKHFLDIQQEQKWQKFSVPSQVFIVFFSPSRRAFIYKYIFSKTQVFTVEATVLAEMVVMMVVI